MLIDEKVYLDDYPLKRKRLVYDKRVHYSYVFVVGNEIYTVIIGSLVDEFAFKKSGYQMPAGVAFLMNGMAEVYSDVFDGIDNLGDFRHVHFEGLEGAVVLQTVSLALIAPKKIN